MTPTKGFQCTHARTLATLSRHCNAAGTTRSLRELAAAARGRFSSCDLPSSAHASAKAGLERCGTLSAAIRNPSAPAFVKRIAARHPSEPCRNPLRTLQPRAPRAFRLQTQARKWLRNEAPAGANASLIETGFCCSCHSPGQQVLQPLKLSPPCAARPSQCSSPATVHNLATVLQSCAKTSALMLSSLIARPNYAHIS